MPLPPPVISTVFPEVFMRKYSIPAQYYLILSFHPERQRSSLFHNYPHCDFK
jgi:hypothetical protein